MKKNRRSSKNIIVIGAGFAGSVAARLIAEAGHNVDIFDKREHIAGNAYDYFDDFGVLVHKYGPHIFHTPNKTIFDFLSNFTDWKEYKHIAKTVVDKNFLPFPINLETLNTFFNQKFLPEECESFIENKRINNSQIANSEDLVLASFGKEIYEKFFKGYSEKQWGIPMKELKVSVASRRIKFKNSYDEYYFNDRYQAMPKNGYTAMFEKMLDHKNINIFLNQEKSKSDLENYDHAVFTGSLDFFYDYKFGSLPYRSLVFEFEHFDSVDYMFPAGQINYPDLQNKFTRITEFKHITGQKCQGTTIAKEYPTSEGDPYYPIPKKEYEDIFKLYKKDSKKEKDCTFIGRLAEYKYYDMHQVVGSSMQKTKLLLKNL